MEKRMMLSEKIALEMAIVEKHGDMMVYLGDMEPLTGADLEVVTALEPEKHGEKFLHIGDW
ncbi:hypothetical protein [Geomonas ferrireducens]|uniref:hypothetical protein n=1 Tax=Geomonas ferrireducens TaxID=2570227 RepID=UPI0010A89215|nr:hypothetical protein [Geomonas ferrireducens]